ncbi:Protein kinase domain containing protein [Ectocarpus siliculosus]|uniref:Protein kinase domain containing protein n=1 Tax=Ectocarpus siliculosus TaxID=2880 RepID=D7G4S6_ECTSI|nr:Protein kinase domain containing protein [Ectocarpus siliculosus]|eukprot:CBJ27169.1 Protein kinase domain containing protein [Ectocarpus siliculosus]
MHLREERHISTKLQGSDFLVRTAGTFQNPRSVVFAMEYLPGGDLYQRLSDKGTLSLRETVAWTAQAVLAIEDLHAKNIVHRDVKPENFLMGKSGTLKLTDFGFARELAPDERLYSQFGTPEYVAAEVLSGGGHGMPVDLWALGVLIYELLVGQTPFKSPSVEEMYERIAAGDYAFPKPPASPACAAAEGSSSNSSLKLCLSSKAAGKSGSSSSNVHKGGVQKQSFSLKKSDSCLSATASKKGGLATAVGPNGADHTRQQAEPAKSKQAQRQEQGTADSNNTSGGGAQDPAAQSLVKALLCLDPSRRPSLPEVKRHPFFAGVDFDGLRAAVRAQADREEEEAVVAAAIEGGDVWVRGQPVVCQSDEMNDNYGGVFVGF